MNKPQSAKARGERRVDGRNKVRKVGRILVDEPQRVYSCIILDLSETGALVLVHDKVPEQFSLFYSAKRTLWQVTVMRRQQDTLGVRFDSALEVLTPSDPRLALLRG